MSLLPITTWSLQSTDGTVWVPSVSNAGLVTWTSGGAVITTTPPVFQGEPDSVVWVPSISNAGIVSITDTGLVDEQRWASLLAPNGMQYIFYVPASGIVSVRVLYGEVLPLPPLPILYEVDCVDWSQILMRRQINRNFVNLPVHGIVESILDNELAGEGLTTGILQSPLTIPLVDASRRVRVFDLMRELASATGQTFFVDFTKAIQMRGAPLPGDRGTGFVGESTPDFVLDESGLPIPGESGGFLLEEEQPIDQLQELGEANVLIDGVQIVQDRETYRNVQTVVVTGTPQVENEDALMLSVQRTNDDQIAERQAVEGGTGRYEEVDEVTHPTSNRLDDLTLLGDSVAQLRLATSGILRTTLTVQVVGYGYRAGQIGIVNLPTLGIAGDFILQRVSVRLRGGIYLFHTLELTSTSMQQRAYESYLAIMAKGKIAIQLFSFVTHSSASFTTPGAANWTVPAGVTVVTVTVKGGSGSGGGGFFVPPLHPGGKGGNSGKAISALTVSEGQELNLFVGSLGTPGGVSGVRNGPAATPGIAGTATTVVRSGIEIARADGGGAGGAAALTNGTPGTNGGGSGGIVTVGGGKTGGAGATTYPGTGIAGQHGSVLIEW